jgi:hypothetical protein
MGRWRGIVNPEFEGFFIGEKFEAGLFLLRRPRCPVLAANGIAISI